MRLPYIGQETYCRYRTTMRLVPSDPGKQPPVYPPWHTALFSFCRRHILEQEFSYAGTRHSSNKASQSLLLSSRASFLQPVIPHRLFHCIIRETFERARRVHVASRTDRAA